MRQFSLTNFLAPDGLLLPAADPSGRIGIYKPLTGAHRVFVVYHIFQGATSTITLSPLQAKDTVGTGVKPITTAKIYANENVLLGSGNFVQQPDGASYTTGIAIAEKIVVFELDPSDAFDLVNAYATITAQTGASNIANTTSAELFVYGSYLGVSGLGLD